MFLPVKSTVCIPMLFYTVGCEVNLSSAQNLHQACSQTVNIRGAVAFGMGAYIYIHSYMYMVLYYTYTVCVFIHSFIHSFIFIPSIHTRS